MTKITIGGKEREGDLAYFSKLKAAWPIIQEAQDLSLAHMDRMSLMIKVVAIAIGEDPDTFEAKVRTTEMANITPFFQAVIREGFPAKGEAAPAGKKAKPSTVTSTPSSQSSSRRAVKAEAGAA